MNQLKDNCLHVDVKISQIIPYCTFSILNFGKVPKSIDASHPF